MKPMLSVVVKDWVSGHVDLTSQVRGWGFRSGKSKPSFLKLIYQWSNGKPRSNPRSGTRLERWINIHTYANRWTWESLLILARPCSQWFRRDIINCVHRNKVEQQHPDVSRSALKTHSWHGVPFLLYSKYARRDKATKFSESECAKGSLGTFEAKYTLSLALAHAGKLDKFGA